MRSSAGCRFVREPVVPVFPAGTYPALRWNDSFLHESINAIMLSARFCCHVHRYMRLDWLIVRYSLMVRARGRYMMYSNGVVRWRWGKMRRQGGKGPSQKFQDVACGCLPFVLAPFCHPRSMAPSTITRHFRRTDRSVIALCDTS